ncbi:hypothetical protein [Nitrosospira sp. Is2]|uniref:hypothetical protein n=1 Tax=Nitrosospira sp. Is2 TaxID=3080532 RepID=UPI002955A0C6|nr:hypothetical protein [Nitrosospira sp. Is2]WON74176.1 hypothetical protein R5L00_01415 [Nitrosospira sp. Is2]
MISNSRKFISSVRRSWMIASKVKYRYAEQNKVGAGQGIKIPPALHWKLLLFLSFHKSLQLGYFYGKEIICKSLYCSPRPCYSPTASDNTDCSTERTVEGNNGTSKTSATGESVSAGTEGEGK